MIYRGTPEQIEELRKIKYFLLDMDGTLYLENTLIDGTWDFLELLKQQGKRPVYVTNNSSLGAKEYIAKLAALDIPSAEEDFCTSATALVYQLNQECPGARLYVLGTPALQQYLTENGYTCVTEYTADPEKRPDVVVVAFDSSLTYEKLQTTCFYISDGVRYWATHPDKCCPVRGGHFVPDAGALISCIESVVKQEPSHIAGKPNPCIVRMIQEKTGAKAEEIAVVGDRLTTDILLAINAGVTSICVLTGECTLEDLTTSSIQPDIVCTNMRDLYHILRG